MKWRIYRTPEFIKLLTSNHIIDSDDRKKVTVNDFDLFLFAEWVEKQLNKKKVINGDSELKLTISDKEEVDNIYRFAQFYIRMVKDPLSGRCAYKEIFDRNFIEIKKSKLSLSMALGIDQSLNNETFIFLSDDKQHSLALTIERIYRPKDKNPEVTVKIIAYS